MARRILPCLIFAAAFLLSAVVCCPNSTLATTMDAGLIAVARGPGGYLSGIKIGLVALVFFIWVKLADWMHRDAVKISEDTEMPPEIWNPINLASCLIGFFVAISLPIFWIGFPIFVLAAILPWISYYFMRRAKVRGNADIKQKIDGTAHEGPVMEELEQDRGIAVSFTPAGADDTEQQSNLIMARQSDGYPALKELIFESMFKRADVVVIDFTQTQVNSKLYVDGAWHGMEPMDRETGDALLVSLKHLGDMDPAERRKAQGGRFSAKTELGKIDIEAAAQGVKTGERVQLKFIRKAGDALPLKKLGMFPSMEKKFSKGLNEPGITAVSAPPGQGLTTTWQGLLVSSDRLTRDNIGIVETDEKETDLENIVIKRYTPGASGDESQLGVLNRTVLSQPDSLAIPKVESKEVMDVLSLQARTQDRAVWLQLNAKSASEALLRLYAAAGNREQFAAAAKHVTCQRLVRRLCSSCRQEIRVKPELIKKLGGDPNKQQSLYGPWKLPPPEQRVDERGKEIEFPPCKTCGGIGYIGRIAAFELIVVNDAIREALKKSPKVESIEAAAKASKAKAGLSQSAYRLVLLGITSLQEVQNVLKS